MQQTALLVKGARCDKCASEAKIILPYGPHRLCAEHFNEFFEHRVRKTVRLNQLVKYGEKIAVGVSGGKDSMVTLHLLNKVFGTSNKIEAIMVDEGIAGYREKAIEIAKNYCAEHKIPYHIVKYEQAFGFDMGNVMKKIHEDRSLGSTCSFCGVFRRDLLNAKALEIGAQKLATGHNLDDEVQSIAMSLFGSDFARLSRLGEIAEGMKGSGKMVPRIKPLYETPEKEVIAYAALNGIEHYSEECCPYSWMAKRNHYRKTLNELEDAMPGTKYGILSSFRKMKPMLSAIAGEGGELRECAKCGNPSAQELCGTCRQLERLVEQEGNGAHGQKGSRGAKKESALSCAQTKGLSE